MARSKRILVSGPMIQEKTLKVTDRLSLTQFKASIGWPNKFRIRRNINFASVCRESGSVDPATVGDWRSKLPQITADYVPRNTYNMDETGLIYRVALKNRSQSKVKRVPRAKPLKIG